MTRWLQLGSSGLSNRGLAVSSAMRFAGAVGGVVAILAVGPVPGAPMPAALAAVVSATIGLAGGVSGLVATRWTTTTRRSLLRVHLVADAISMLVIATAIDPAGRSGGWVLLLVPVAQAGVLLGPRVAGVVWLVLHASMAAVLVAARTDPAGSEAGALALILFLSMGPTGILLAQSSLLRSALAAAHDANDELAHSARTDELTGLCNRRGLHDEVATRTVDGSGYHVLFCDLDGFKAVNDTLGHDAGDEVLRVVARRLTGAVRPDDLVARIAGDEFAVVLVDADDRVVQSVRDRLRETVEQELEVRGATVAVGISVGIATGSADDELGHVLDAADAAMYADKARRTDDGPHVPVRETPQHASSGSRG